MSDIPQDRIKVWNSWAPSDDEDKTKEVALPEPRSFRGPGRYTLMRRERDAFKIAIHRALSFETCKDVTDKWRLDEMFKLLKEAVGK